MTALSESLKDSFDFETEYPISFDCRVCGEFCIDFVPKKVLRTNEYLPFCARHEDSFEAQVYIATHFKSKKDKGMSLTKDS